MNEFMNIAIDEARIAYNEGNVPVGAVLVCDNKVIAACHNTKNSSNIAINHAEILCIVEGCKYFDSWYLSDCDLYVTLKPCEMCVGAIGEARIRNVYYLLESNYSVNLGKNIDNINFSQLGFSSEYKDLISSFFEKLRS